MRKNSRPCDSLLEKSRLCFVPNINDNDKEWCKEFVEKIVKMELGKLEMELGEVMSGQKN